MKLKHIAAGAIMAFAMASSVQGALITGEINLTASAGTTVSVDFTTNTVTFTNTGVLPYNTQVDASSGDLAVIAPVTTGVEYDNFGYQPLDVTNPLWVLFGGGLTFDITSISTVSELGSGDLDDSQGLTLFGSGILNAPGYDPTPATWSFGANRASGASEFSFGSTAAAQAADVPDGGTSVALLGFSLLGLAGAHRKFAKQ